MKKKRAPEVGEDIPFGLARLEYSYRCLLCDYEFGDNKAMVDAAIMWSELDGEYSDGFMPTIDCRNCNRHEFVFVGFGRPPEGR